MTALTILVGSVYGNSQHAAETVAEKLGAAGIECEVISDPQVSDVTDASALLVITSTTGQGDIPPNLEFLFSDLKDEFSLLDKKPFAVVGLGDSSYGDSYCAGGKQWFELLTELQGKPVADMLEVDAIEHFEPEAPVVEYVESIKNDLIPA